ncbi:MAG TPA: porin family protein [Bacteroidia bacterium]|nr:porin family protein [Bacteroidia bacterium]HRG52660.1 porin family protein [Bacteroidia bacterium]
MNIGIEGGPSAIKFTGNEIAKEYQQFDVGYSAGLSFQYNFKHILALRSGVALERKGAAIRDVVFTDNNANKLYSADFHYHYDYMVVPVLLRASFGKKVNVFINAGPYVSYLLQARGTYKDPNEGKVKSDFTNQIKKLDWGASAGLGASIPIKEKLIASIEVRNNLGLYNISDLPVYNDGSIKTFSSNLLVGLAYKLGSTSE